LKSLVLLGFAGWAFTLGGCASAPPMSDSLTGERAQLYSHTATTFEVGTLYKPRPIPAMGLPLAPLIIHEWPVPDLRSNGLPGRLGKVTSSGVNPNEPVVYVGESEIAVSGRRHPQVTFIWVPESATAEKAPTVRGVRMTLDAAGQPVIWEALGESEHLRVFYVARSLEAAAGAEYGPPLTGRRYAIEPGVAVQPRVMVVKVVDDGPMPMGPIVYVNASRTINSISCRCTPAQVRQVPATMEYDLIDAPALQAAVMSSDRGDVVALAGLISARLGTDPDQHSLEECLRLPAGF
jgi:hypothetical protein